MMIVEIGPMAPVCAVTVAPTRSTAIITISTGATVHRLALSSESQITGAATALSGLFNGTTTPGTQHFIYDDYDMTMTIGVVGTLLPVIFLALLASGEVPLKPVGVLVNYVRTSVSGEPIFGFDIENEYISGWDVGAWAVPLL